MSRTITWKGQTRTWADWAEHLGLDREGGAAVLRKRERLGWKLDAIFTLPIRRWQMAKTTTKTFQVTMTVVVDASGNWPDPAHPGKYIKMPVTALDVAQALASSPLVFDSFDAAVEGMPTVTAVLKPN